MFVPVKPNISESSKMYLSQNRFVSVIYSDFVYAFFCFVGENKDQVENSAWSWC